jgi:hypothetical protein
MVSLPFWIFAVIGLGVTVFGDQRCLRYRLWEVSVSPDAVLALSPEMFTGSTFVIFTSDGVDTWDYNIAVCVSASIECHGNKRHIWNGR